MVEVTVTSIMDGVKDKLNSMFPDMDIWIEEIKQGFQAPCFFVKLLTTAQEQELNRRYKRSYAFDIHFFPGGPDYNREAHDMAERLYDELRSVSIDGALYKGTSMTHEVVDGTLHFFFDLNFHVMAPKEDIPKMKTLEQEGYIKHG